MEQPSTVKDTLWLALAGCLAMPGVVIVAGFLTEHWSVPAQIAACLLGPAYAAGSFLFTWAILRKVVGGSPCRIYGFGRTGQRPWLWSATGIFLAPGIMAWMMLFGLMRLVEIAWGSLSHSNRTRKPAKYTFPHRKR